MSFGGIDIGTSGCKCTLFNEQGEQLAVSYRAYQVLRDRGHHEIPVRTIWNAVKEVIFEAASAVADPPEAICVSSFGESCFLLDEHDDPVFPAIIYTDIRGAEEAVHLAENPGSYPVYEISGHRPNSTYTLPKLMYLKNHEPERMATVRTVLPIASGVMYFLTGEKLCDLSLASRTMMLDINEKEWSNELLSLAGLTRRMMPPVADIGTVAGTIRKELAYELGIPDSVKIIAGGHDQVVAAIGAGTGAGSAVNSSGTVECVTPVFSGRKHSWSLFESHFATVPIRKDLYATYATIFSGGALLQWFTGNFAGNTDYTGLETAAKDEPTGIFVLPHFAGSASPYYDPDSKGAVLGLTLEHTPADVFQALQEGICYEVMLNLEYLAEAGITVDSLRIVGGGMHSKRWNQMKADMYGIPCTTLKTEEAGAIGSAMFSGVALGIYPDIEQAARALVREDVTYQPRNRYHESYAGLYRRYKGIYSMVKGI